MLLVVFNIEAGNYYSKSTFIVTLIKQEKLCVHIGYCIHCGVFTHCKTYIQVIKTVCFWLFREPNTRYRKSLDTQVLGNNLVKTKSHSIYNNLNVYFTIITEYFFLSILRLS